MSIGLRAPSAVLAVDSPTFLATMAQCQQRRLRAIHASFVISGTTSSR
jgi:hypothetical protein